MADRPLALLQSAMRRRKRTVTQSWRGLLEVLESLTNRFVIVVVMGAVECQRYWQHSQLTLSVCYVYVHHSSVLSLCCAFILVSVLCIHHSVLCIYVCVIWVHHCVCVCCTLTIVYYGFITVCAVGLSLCCVFTIVCMLCIHHFVLCIIYHFMLCIHHSVVYCIHH